MVELLLAIQIWLFYSWDPGEFEGEDLEYKMKF